LITNKLTPEMLQAVGEALYGPRWHSDLARDLDVQVRSVQRWMAGERRMPDIRSELRQIITERRNDLGGLLALLGDDNTSAA